MTTETIDLTSDPVQITTGTESAYVSADEGVFRFSDSDTKPTQLKESHVAKELSINPPFVIWVWAGSGYGTKVRISKR